MTKREFIDTLRLSLTGRMTTGTVLDHVNYYEEYFANQMYQGYTEEEICRTLGDPHLIAKSLIAADKFEGSESTFAEGEIIGDEKKKATFKSFKIPGFLIVLVVLLVVFFLISAAFSIFVALLPYIIPVALVLYAIKFFKTYR
ncbi:MAG: DUF1700 domain-containing protein [Lachnospiraceae bacterium]